MVGLNSLKKYVSLKKLLKEASCDLIQRILYLNITSEHEFIERGRSLSQSTLDQLDNFLKTGSGSGSIGKEQIIEIESNEIFPRVLSLNSIRYVRINEQVGRNEVYYE